MAGKTEPVPREICGLRLCPTTAYRVNYDRRTLIKLVFEGMKEYIDWA